MAESDGQNVMIRKLFSSQLRVNMVSGPLTTVINSVVMIIAYPVFLHFLGYEKYGVWLILGTVLTFAQLGDLGIGPAIVKLVAEEHGRNDIKGVQRYITTALAMLCISGTVVLLVILALKNQITASASAMGEATTTGEKKARVINTPHPKRMANRTFNTTFNLDTGTRKRVSPTIITAPKK